MFLSKSKLAIYSSLGTAKMRRKHSLFAVEGEKSVVDTLSVFDPVAIIHLDDYDPVRLALSSAASHSPASGSGLSSGDTVPPALYSVDSSTMRRISSLSTPPSVMAIYRLPVDDFDCTNLPRRLYVVLDAIQDPGNLGTIIRTCHWFGIKHIFASRDTVDLFNPKTVISTMGSIAHVGVHYCDLQDLFAANPDMPVCGMLLDGENIYKATLPDHGFIVMGNEGNGISPAIRARITTPLLIPPADADHSESLNVAIATAITLSHFQAHR